jgi:hypothetical protein
MAAPGPDPETWKKMTPLGKAAYWLFIGAIGAFLTYLFFIA